MPLESMPKPSETLYQAQFNKFDIVYSSKPENNDEISKKAVECFKKNPGIDTVLYLAPVANISNAFHYFVLERDGSWSDFCGNGAMAAAKFLQTQNKNLPNELILRNVKGVDTKVSAIEGESKQRYAVQFEKVTSSETDSKSFTDFFETPFDGNFNPSQVILEQLSHFSQNPDALNEFFPDESDISAYDTYFARWVAELKKEPSLENKFLEFAAGLTLKKTLQAGGEPHALIEMTSLAEPHLQPLFLKLASMMMRFQKNKQGALQYPKGMNFMFFKVAEGGEVSMYPAERGVYNGIHSDQTMACGSGSACLGWYLLTEDSRFANQESITILNRLESLEIQKTAEGAKLIGSAEKSSEIKKNPDTETLQKFNKLPFTAQCFFEKQEIYNPKGEDEINEIVEGAPLVKNIRKHLVDEDCKLPVFTTIDHPNPDGYIDWYTVFGYYFGAEIACYLKLPLQRNSLDTTGTKGANFPFTEENTNVDWASELQGAKPNATLLQILSDAIKTGSLSKIKSMSDFENKIPDLLKNKYTKSKLKESVSESLVDELITLSYLSATGNNGEVKKFQQELEKYTQGEEVELPAELKILLSNANKKSVLITAITKGLNEYIKNYSGKKLTGNQRLNAFQTCIKSALLSPVFAFGFTPDQKDVMKKAKVMDGNNYVTPELYSTSENNKGFNFAAAEMFRSKPQLMAKFYTFVCKEQQKNELVLFILKEEPEKRITFSADGHFYIGKQTTSAGEIADRICSENEAVAVANGSVFYPVIALTMAVQLGSERGYRELFLQFLAENLHTFPPEEESYYLSLIRVNKGLICDDYNPGEYNKENKKTPVKMPISTDNLGSGNPILDFMNSGTKELRAAMQEYLVDPSCHTKI